VAAVCVRAKEEGRKACDPDRSRSTTKRKKKKKGSAQVEDPLLCSPILIEKEKKKDVSLPELATKMERGRMCALCRKRGAPDEERLPTAFGAISGKKRRATHDSVLAC